MNKKLILALMALMMVDCMLGCSTKAEVKRNQDERQKAEDRQITLNDQNQQLKIIASTADKTDHYIWVRSLSAASYQEAVDTCELIKFKLASQTIVDEIHTYVTSKNKPWLSSSPLVLGEPQQDRKDIFICVKQI